MKINIRQKDNIVIIDVEGNIDINASAFVESVGWAVIKKSKDILCNFGGVNLVDYIGISLITVAVKNILNHDGRVKFYNLPTHVSQLFCIVGLDRVLDVFANEELALNSFKEEQAITQILKEKLRRRFKRIDACGLIEYKQKFSLRGGWCKGKILNLSGTGVFVLVEKLFSIGEIITLRMLFSSEKEWLDLEAKVVWLADKEIQPLESPGMGLEFYNITPEKQEKILKFIEKNIA